jgi:hypothetical protein
MTKIAPAVFAFATLLLCLHAAPAQAQLTRSFVSGTGSDSNNCGRLTPCRTFAFALTQTAAGGEINTLDPAGYGPVTINKSISIVSGLGEAGVLVASGGTGITVAAGATDKVNLRGLVIEGAGAGLKGIVVTSVGSLTIENCVVRNLTNNAIEFAPNAASTLAVSNTMVANTGSFGILVLPTGTGAVKTVFSKVEAYNNVNDGVSLSGASLSSGGSLSGTITESVASYNSNGFAVATGGGAVPTTLMVVRSMSSGNNTGVRANNNGAVVRLAQSTLTNNNIGVAAVSSGSILSYADNYIDGNTSGEAAPPTNPPVKK